MKKLTLTLSVIAVIAIVGAVAYKELVPNIVHPLLKAYGPVYDVPFAVERPDTTIEYKIVCDVGEKIEKPGDIYPPLVNIARMYNLHIYGGVQQKNLQMAVVFGGDPITVILNDEAYKKKYGVGNPNLKIIEEMKNAGVKFYACGQSMMKFGVDPANVNPAVTVAVSRYTAVSTFQMKGYAYFKL